MGKNFVQQVEVVADQAAKKPSTFAQKTAFFDAAGNPLNLGASATATVRGSVKKAAANADVATANATDLATAIALANQLKTTVNGLQGVLRTAGTLT